MIAYGVVVLVAIFGLAFVGFFAVLASIVARTAWHLARLALPASKPPGPRTEPMLPHAAPARRRWPLVRGDARHVPLPNPHRERAFWGAHVFWSSILLLGLGTACTVAWIFTGPYPANGLAYLVALLLLLPLAEALFAVALAWWVVAVGSWAKWARRSKAASGPSEGHSA